MITSIRKRFKSRQLQATIWLAVFALSVLFSPELIKRFTDGKNWALSVNSITVTPEEFMRKVQEYRQRIEALQQQFGPQAHKLMGLFGGATDPNEYAYQESIKDALINQVGESLDVYISPEYLNQEIIKMLPAGLIDSSGKVDLHALGALLGYPADEFERSMKQYIKRSIINDLVGGSVLVPEFELKNLYNSVYRKKTYSILTFPFEKYVREAKKEGISQQELAMYFDKEKSNYWVSEKRSGKVWEVTPANFSLNVSDKEIQSYYDKHKKDGFVKNPTQIQVRRILFSVKDKQNLQEVRQEAQKALFELRQDPTKFAEYAKKYSADRGTAAQGGLLDFFAKGEKEPVFEHVAFGLKKDGEVSEIFETEEGLEIIQRASKKPLAYKLLDEVKDEIKKELINQKFKNAFSLDVRRAKDNPENIEKYINEKGLKAKNIGPVDQSDSGLSTKKLFELNKVNGVTFYIEGDRGYIVKLIDIQKRYLPELDSIKSNVEKDYYEQKARVLLEKDMTKAKDLANKQSFEQIKDLLGIKLRKTGMINQDDQVQISELKEDRIPVSKMFEVDKEGIVVDQLTNTDGYLFKINSLSEFNSDDFNSKKQVLERQLYNERKNALQEGFIASLQKNATIKVNEKLLSKQVKQRLRK